MKAHPLNAQLVVDVFQLFGIVGTDGQLGLPGTDAELPMLVGCLAERVVSDLKDSCFHSVFLFSG